MPLYGLASAFSDNHYLQINPTMIFDRKKVSNQKMIQVDLYINYGDDEIRHQKVKVVPGASVLDVLREAAEVEFWDESITGHLGSMVTAVDGFRTDLNHCWIYYVFEPGQGGWRIPDEMPDATKAIDCMRIGWRYCEYTAEKGRLDGPLFTSRCAGKLRTCARQF